MSESQSDEKIRRELNTLTEVSKTLITHADLPELLDAVMERIINTFPPAEFGVVFIWYPQENVFRPHGICGKGIHNPQILKEMRLRAGEAITGKVYECGKALLLNSPAEIAEIQSNMNPNNLDKFVLTFGDEPPHSMVAAQLCAGDHKYGVLFLGSLKSSTTFSSRDLKFVQTLADLIALVVDRVRLETESTETNVARQAEFLRAEAMATLSHELRTPMASIKGYSTALLLEDISWSKEKEQEFLRLIDEECDNLQTMINDILTSSLLDVNQLSIELEPVRLERLTQEVVREMQHHTEIHHLVVDFPDDFPIVNADPLRIKQVIRNIIDNAIKYSPTGGLVMVRGEVRPNDIVISISDQGVGISREDLIPLFDKYFRVKSPTGYHVPGTGLGLPVARAIVEAHSGRIWAESNVGEGTALFFSIPSESLSPAIENE